MTKPMIEKNNGWLEPEDESSSEDDFSFDDICEEIEFSFRENFEKTFLHVH